MVVSASSKAGVRRHLFLGGRNGSIVEVCSSYVDLSAVIVVVVVVVV